MPNAMVQKTIQITPEQADKLNELAGPGNVVAAIREAIEQWIKGKESK